MESVILNVKGMSCGHCVKAVEGTCMHFVIRKYVEQNEEEEQI